MQQGICSVNRTIEAPAIRAPDTCIKTCVDNDTEWTMDEGKGQTMVDDMMFPAQPEDGSSKEASLRLLPEYIGDFNVT